MTCHIWWSHTFEVFTIAHLINQCCISHHFIHTKSRSCHQVIFDNTPISYCHYFITLNDVKRMIFPSRESRRLCYFYSLILYLPCFPSFIMQANSGHCKRSVRGQVLNMLIYFWGYICLLVISLYI